ncbi:MAG: transposase [Parabacteroides johnsonii]
MEKENNDLINSEEEIKNNYERITSIKGVAFVNALALIVYTENFTCFDDPRKLACYAGVVRSNEPPDPVSKVTQRPVDLPIKN